MSKAEMLEYLENNKSEFSEYSKAEIEYVIKKWKENVNHD